MEGGGSHHARLCVGHTSACVVHAPMRGGWIGEQLAVERSGESLDHGGVAHVVVELPEVD